MAAEVTPGARVERRAKRPFLALLFSLLISGVFLVTLEFAFRWQADRFMTREAQLRDFRRYSLEGRVDSFKPRPYFGFARPIGDQGVNSLGFIGPEWPLERTPGVLRVACLGGSTTEGGNRDGYEGSYPYFLQLDLERRLGAPVEVLNCGVSAWTTAEMVCAWFLLVQDYEPDVMILHEVVNDVGPRDSTVFRPDYSHYRKTWSTKPYDPVTKALIRNSDLFAWALSRKGLPTIDDIINIDTGQYGFRDGRFPPETYGTFERNVLTLGRTMVDRGGRVLLATLPTQPGFADSSLNKNVNWRTGVDEHNQVFRDVAEREGWMLCDLAAFAPAEERAANYFIDLVHVNATGNQWKAGRIGQVLHAEWLEDLARNVMKDG